MIQQSLDTDGETRAAIERLRSVLEASGDGRLSEAQMELVSRFSDLMSQFGEVSKENVIVSILDHVGNYWRNGIIILLHTGSYRPSTLVRIFKSLNESRPISRRMLTLNLKILEREGIAKRIVISEEINHVEYKLTDVGRELSSNIINIIDWSVANYDYFIRSRHEFDSRKSE